MSRPPRAVTYADLPLYARIAIEWADNNTKYRNTAGVSYLCHFYANASGTPLDNAMVDAAIEIGKRRFYNFNHDETFGSN